MVTGANGEGKTNLLEAIGYLATLRSFRGSPGEALIRVGAAQAVVRAEGEREGRHLLIEAELRPAGRDRVQVNRQPLRRTRDLLGAFQVTVFAPDDLALVKGGPQGRREYLDDLLVALHPRHDATRTEVDRVLRQRNALLESAQGQAAARSRRGHHPRRVGRQAGRGGRDPGRAPGRVWWLHSEHPPALAYAQLAAGAAEPGARPGETRLPPELDGIAGRRPGRRPRRRPASGRDHRRSAPRRAGVERRRPARPYPRLPGRAAVLGPGLAPGRPRSGHRPLGDRARSCCSTTCSPSSMTNGPQALYAVLPPGQAILTTAGVLPPGAKPACQVRVEGGSITAWTGTG